MSPKSEILVSLGPTVLYLITPILFQMRVRDVLSPHVYILRSSQ